MVGNQKNTFGLNKLAGPTNYLNLKRADLLGFGRILFLLLPAQLVILFARVSRANNTRTRSNPARANSHHITLNMNMFVFSFFFLFFEQYFSSQGSGAQRLWVILIGLVVILVVIVRLFRARFPCFHRGGIFPSGSFVVAGIVAGRSIEITV